MIDLTFDPAALKELLDAMPDAPWRADVYKGSKPWSKDIPDDKGEWSVSCQHPDHPGAGYEHWRLLLATPGFGPRAKLIAAFIAAARNELPALLDALAAAREELAETEREARMFNKHWADAVEMLKARRAERDAARAEADKLRAELAEVYELAQKADRDGFGNVLTSDLYRVVTPPIADAVPAATEAQPADLILSGTWVVDDSAFRAPAAEYVARARGGVGAVPGDGEQAATTCGHQHTRLLRQPGDRPILCTLLAGHYGDHGEPETGSHWDRDSFYGNVATGDPKPVVTLLCSDKAGFHDEHYYRAEPGDGLSHCPGVQPTSGRAS